MSTTETDDDAEEIDEDLLADLEERAETPEDSLSFEEIRARRDE